MSPKSLCLPEGVTTNTGDRPGGVRQGFDDVATVGLRTPVKQPVALHTYPPLSTSWKLVGNYAINHMLSRIESKDIKSLGDSPASGRDLK